MPPDMPGPTFSFRRLLWILLLLAAVSAGLYAVFATVGYAWNWRRAWEYRGQFLHGWLLTLGLSLAAMTLSIGVGLALLLGRRAPVEPVRLLCTGRLLHSRHGRPARFTAAGWHPGAGLL
jgi:polar amino acid transport system permease protein